MVVDQAGVEPKKRHWTFRVNLPTKFRDALHHFSDANFPRERGILFAYNSDLSKFDQSTVVDVIRRRFFGCLGSSEEDADSTFQNLRSAWGAFYKSETGKILSHIFKVIDIALTLQTRVCPIITRGSYVGCLMTGDGYYLSIMGLSYSPGSIEEVEAVMRKADPHSNSLWRIFSRINFNNDEDRRTQFQLCRRMCHLAHLLERLSVGGTTTQAAVMKDAMFLNFVEDQPFTITAVNISTVLNHIADGTKDLATLPYRHHSTLFETARHRIALSAFGATAPSFRVAGGKAMVLTQPFAVRAKAPAPATGFVSKAITKIGCNVVPLNLAIRHFEDMVSQKEILNPFANAQIRVSDNNLFKSYSAESCGLIVEGLRKVCGAKVTDAVQGSSRKRKADDDVGGSRKKSHAF